MRLIFKVVDVYTDCKFLEDPPWLGCEPQWCNMIGQQSNWPQVVSDGIGNKG